LKQVKLKAEHDKSHKNKIFNVYNEFQKKHYVEYKRKWYYVGVEDRRGWYVADWYEDYNKLKCNETSKA
jgi:hypothetical protein